MFPDSQIAQQFKCCKTKTTSILNEAIQESKFYDMCVTTDEYCGIGEVLFQAINNNFIRDSIDWQNVKPVGLDNTNVNMVCNNSIKTRVLEKNPNSFIAGCNCHLSHLAAAKGADAFSSVTGFDIEDHKVDIYYYFSKSTKRNGVLLKFLGFVDLEWGQVILKSMFTSRNESDEES